MRVQIVDMYKIIIAIIQLKIILMRTTRHRILFLKNKEIPNVLHLLIALVFICATDIVITGLLSVIRRRLIFVSKSKYIDGLPFYLILISLVVMLAETCLYSLPGL